MQLSYIDISIRLWHDRINADFEIVCGTYNFKIHKLVLRIYSDALARAADNMSFKVGHFTDFTYLIYF